MPPISLPHDIRFHQLSAEDLPTLRRFYRQHGHKGKPASHEVCYALSHTDCKIVAGIRFRPYQPDHLLFRGLWVAKDKRYQGLGKTLLNLSIEAIGHSYPNHKVVCFCEAPLKTYYQQFGFKDYTHAACANSPAYPLHSLVTKYCHNNGLLYLGKV